MIRPVFPPRLRPANETIAEEEFERGCDEIAARNVSGISCE
jgi:hypothetical protein